MIKKFFILMAFLNINIIYAIPSETNYQPSKTVITGIAVGTLAFGLTPYVLSHEPQWSHTTATAAGASTLIALYKEPLYRIGRKVGTVLDVCCRKLSE